MAELEEQSIEIKTPKRILHFSDGTLEEFDENETKEINEPEVEEIDVKSMTWTPWLIHQASKTGATVLSGLDYAGESLASFFGLNSKYSSEIEEFKRQQALQEQEDLEEKSNSWPISKYTEVITEVP
ncbi:unnamed protein product, partial [Diamesa serratosioi]